MLSFIDEDYLATVIPVTNTYAMCHIASGNIKAYYITKRCISYLREKTYLNSLIALVPDNNNKAKRLLKLLNFKYNGIQDKSFLKDGNLMDQSIFTRVI